MWKLWRFPGTAEILGKMKLFSKKEFLDRNNDQLFFILFGTVHILAIITVPNLALPRKRMMWRFCPIQLKTTLNPKLYSSESGFPSLAIKSGKSQVKGNLETPKKCWLQFANQQPKNSNKMNHSLDYHHFNIWHWCWGAWITVFDRWSTKFSNFISI